MVTALKSEGESITKLEKADVLELTVKYLRKLKRQNALGLTPSATYAAKFRVGYVHCAQDVSRFMTTMQQQPQQPNNNSVVDVHVSTRLLAHLANCCQALESMPPSVVSMAMSPPPPPPAMLPHQPPAMSPGYSHLPTSAFSPVQSAERQLLIKEEDEQQRFELRSQGKENQAMDLSKPSSNQGFPLKSTAERMTHPKEDPSWRPWWSKWGTNIINSVILKTITQTTTTTWYCIYLSSRSHICMILITATSCLHMTIKHMCLNSQFVQP